MKKSVCIFLGITLALCAFAFAACGPDGKTTTPPEESRSLSETENNINPNPPKDAETLPESGTEPDAPAVSPLAALDKIEISQAFGDTTAEGWSFALRSAGSADAAGSFRWTSQVSGREKFYSELGAGVSLDDTFGIRSGGNASGIDLFGGGNATLALRYTDPKPDFELNEKTFTAGFKHDGGLILYTDADGTEKQVTLGEIKEKLNVLTGNATLKRISEAVETVPENVKKGLSLRLAVEKLIDLGFTFEIDDGDGLTIKLIAKRAFFTDLLNDLLEEFLPEDWLPYIPRADFGYKSTDFEITLAFDGNGLFSEYSISGDIALELSLEVRNLFKCESGFTFESGFSISADCGNRI